MKTHFQILIVLVQNPYSDRCTDRQIIKSFCLKKSRLFLFFMQMSCWSCCCCPVSIAHFVTTRSQIKYEKSKKNNEEKKIRKISIFVKVYSTVNVQASLLINRTENKFTDFQLINKSFDSQNYFKVIKLKLSYE